MTVSIFNNRAIAIDDSLAKTYASSIRPIDYKHVEITLSAYGITSDTNLSDEELHQTLDKALRKNLQVTLETNSEEGMQKAFAFARTAAR